MYYLLDCLKIWLVQRVELLAISQSLAFFFFWKGSFIIVSLESGWSKKEGGNSFMNVDVPQAWVGKLGKVWLRAKMWVQALAFLLLQGDIRHSTWIRTLPTWVRVFESSVLASGPTLGVRKILRKWGSPGGNRSLGGRLSEVLLVLWLLACSLLLPRWK